MQLLVYTAPFNRAARILLETFRTLEETVCSEHITSLEALGLHLRKPMGVPSVGILIPPDNGEMTELVNLRHLLRDMRIILVLPNTDPATMTEAHLLRPRYISYGEDDLSDVIAVTTRMVRTLNRGPLRLTDLARVSLARVPSIH